MREQDFRAYMRTLTSPRGTPLTEGNMNFYATACINIENAENKNLDEEFQKDGMASVSRLYSYSVQDKRDNRPNPTKVKLTKSTVYSTLSDHKTALNHYRKFCLVGGDAPIQESLDSNNDTETIAEADSSTTFRLEKDMQDAIRENIAQLDPTLEIIDSGVERKVASGFIDILAKDSNGFLVVIELKAGKAQDSVIAQILGYMNDIAEEEKANVRGIIVASDFNQRLRSAARFILNLELNSYSYTFDFKNEE